MPCANLASTSAVAGTTTRASMACATEMCSTAESIFGCSFPAENISVITFSPESAAKVSGRMNSWAERVMMTCTRIPRSCSRRTISAALYAAMPPETPRATFMKAFATQPECLLLHRIVQHFRRDIDRCLWDFRNHPFHLAGFDFVLRNPARLSGMSVDDRRRTTLQLPRPAGRHQDIAIVAIESFNELHRRLPCY